MPYEVSWYHGKRITLQRFWGVVTVDDIRGANADGTILQREGIPPIHTVVDSREVEKFPLSLGQIKQAMANNGDDRQGWIIVVAKDNPLMRFIASMATQLSVKNARFRIVQSMDDALAFLTDRDVTLDLSKDEQPTPDS